MPGSGFESDDNELSVFWADGGRELGKAPKSLLARWLIELIAERYHGQAV
jgi:phosphopantothenoylcysteine decarboxylase/phosphopantothenate--cysteine ligase